MPRRIPPFDKQLALHNLAAISIVKAGEIAHSTGSDAIRKEWTLVRLEALYELAFLRSFAAWEGLLEAVFYRSLCGYASKSGQENLVAGRYYPNIGAAEQAVLAGRSYSLWHDPLKVIARCRAHITPGGGPCVQETVIASNLTRLTSFAHTRHRIVHEQSDARYKFDAATTGLAGRTYPASRPGKFLRDFDTSSSPPRRWLDVITGELVTLATQIT